MKTKKMIGAIALTAALALGTMPAFAASVGNDTSTFGDNGDDTASGDTTVKAQLVNEQLNCTVPLEVTVVMGSKGHSEIQAPSATAYGITNNSTTADVELNKIEVKDAAFTMVGAIPASANTDQVTLTWEADGIKTWLGTSHGIQNIGTSDRNLNNYEGTAWGYSYSTSNRTIVIEAGQTLDIQLGGEAYFKNTVDASALTDSTLCKIVYTIGVV